MTEDNIKNYNHEYYLANKNKKDEYSKAYYLDNKEKYKANGKKHYKKHRDKLIENGKMYYANNRDKIIMKNRMKPRQSKTVAKQAIIDANLADLLVKKELYKQKLLDELIV